MTKNTDRPENADRPDNADLPEDADRLDNADLPEDLSDDASAADATPLASSPADRPTNAATPANVTAPTERLGDHGVTAPAAPATTTTADRAPRRRVGKRAWVIGGAVAGVLVLGGTGLAIADEVTDGSDALDDTTRDRVASAAIAAADGGELIDAERDDDGGYEAEVRRADGVEVDVNLDEGFAVVSTDRDSDTDTGSDSDSDD